MGSVASHLDSVGIGTKSRIQWGERINPGRKFLLDLSPIWDALRAGPELRLKWLTLQLGPVPEELAACDPGSAQARVDQLKASPSSASRFRLPNIRNIHSEVARSTHGYPVKPEINRCL
jgi:hypothetical protein